MIFMKMRDAIVHFRWWWSAFMDELSPLKFYSPEPPGFKGDYLDIYTLEGEMILSGKRIFRRRKLKISDFTLYFITFAIFYSIFVLYYNIELEYLNASKDYLK